MALISDASLQRIDKVFSRFCRLDSLRVSALVDGFSGSPLVELVVVVDLEGVFEPVEDGLILGLASSAVVVSALRESSSMAS